MSKLRTLITLVESRGSCSYNEDNKEMFRKASTGILKELAPLIGGTKKDVRFNAGGIAVSGDATLHTDNFYISMNADMGSSLGILARTCKHKKDYTGGGNNWIPFRELADLHRVAEIITGMR